MDLEVHDLIGGLGALVLLITYFLLQVNRIEAKSMLYSQLNAVGSGMILVSLCYDFNFSAFVIESAWLVISILGAIVTLRSRNGVKSSTDSLAESTPEKEGVS